MKTINKFKEIYQIKIDIENIISDKFKKEQKLYKLISDQNSFNKYFSNNAIYIPILFNQLWASPNSISTILLKADKYEIKNNLADFFVNNFYGNISSLHNKDEQLLYIITKVLKEEINSLKDINNNIMSEDRCAFILKEFGKKNEVIFFFKKILINVIKIMKTKYSSENIILETNAIYNALENKDKNNNFDNDNKENYDLFNDKYIYRSIDKAKLEEKKSEYKNKEMSEYLDIIISDCNSSPNKYINETLLENIAFSDKYEEIMNYYKQSFFQTIDLINNLIDNLLNNIDSVPYSIKCICKIISIFIKKKFPKEIKLNQNKFLFKFFFNNLFFPFLQYPFLNYYINEIFIKESTIKKIFIIIIILNNLLRGKLFEKNQYTPFNWYIIEKMPKVFELYKNICQVTLPNVVQKLINDELPENYEYDFFKENPNKNILYRNIYFNIDQLYSLISIVEKYKDEIKIDKTTLSKLQNNIRILEKLKNKKFYEEKQQEYIQYNILEQKEVNNYYLFIDLINNNKLDKIIKMTKNKKKHFTLKELKEIETEEQKIENCKIKVKNCFYSLLYSYQLISKDEFKEDKLSDIISILKELRAHPNLITFIDMNNKYIPLNWYIDSLLQYLPKLPEELKKNDYEALLNELENEITNSINEINFNETDEFIQYLKEIEKEKDIYDHILNLINDLDIHNKAKRIIKEELIYLDLKDIKDNQLVQLDHFFKNIMKDKDFSNLFEKNSQYKYYNTINSFIKRIPNIAKYQNMDFDIFNFLEKKQIPEIIENYFTLIKLNFKQKQINEKSVNDIYNKIYDYIMEGLYDKLFPKEPTKRDIKIYQNCFKHIWIEPQNLFKEKKDYIFDNYLPESISYLKKFENEKSPRQKLFYLGKLFNCIYNLAAFNSDKADNADDEISLLNYTFIQSKPERIDSNTKYTELFLTSNQATGIEGNQLSKMLLVCNKMENPTVNDFYNLSESDYIMNFDMIKKGLLY